MPCLKLTLMTMFCKIYPTGMCLACCLFADFCVYLFLSFPFFLLRESYSFAFPSCDGSLQLRLRSTLRWTLVVSFVACRDNEQPSRPSKRRRRRRKLRSESRACFSWTGLSTTCRNVTIFILGSLGQPQCLLLVKRT